MWAFHTPTPQEIRQRRWGPQKEALSAGAYWLEPVSVFQEAGPGRLEVARFGGG